MPGQSKQEEPTDYGEVFGLARATGPELDIALPESRADWEEVVRKVNNEKIDTTVLLAMTMRDDMPQDLNTPEFRENFNAAYRTYILDLIHDVQFRVRTY